MSSPVTLAESILGEAGYAVMRLSAEKNATLLFESDTILGFAVEFDTVARLIEEWESTTSKLAAQHQLGLRRSGAKAWNAYGVLLTAEDGGEAIKAVLNSIEENLVGMRKIVRDGVDTHSVATRALLPLLPFIRSPELPSINMEEEIRIRTGGVPADALKAFFSSAGEAVTLQVIEES